MFTSLLLAASFGLVSVTNLAGHVMTGELTSVTNGKFTVSGRTLPLRILPKGEQDRLLRLAGCDMRTPAERRKADLLERELRSVDLREQAGQITHERAETLRTAIRAAVRKMP